MGKGRSPCCDKASVKKGPWSQAEDLKLISFIQKHGHSNWRALPKLAGLARCGKSCRLRWVNYLRPDLKRGNLTLQEEETIIKLHEVFGNRWSKIASHFPRRTDNEIKNIWNTYLKKRIKIKEVTSSSLKDTIDGSNKSCSQEVLMHQTSPIDKIILEDSSSSSCSYSSRVSLPDNQMSAINPELEKGVPNSHVMVENVYDKGGTCLEVDRIKGDSILQPSIDYAINKEDSLEELIEIPFDPNLELWDLLDGDSINLADQRDAQYIELKSPLSLNPISGNDKKNCGESDDGMWWWLVYLENELGLNHNESTLLQASSGPNDALLFKEQGRLFSDITI